MHRTRRLFVPLACAIALAAFVPAHGAEPTVTDGTIESFDGTKILYHLFLPADASASNKVPVVLMTHGWGGSGQTTYDLDVKLLVDDGYAVLTWDQRGFGSSGGEANINAQEFEVRDVQALISFVAGRPEIQTDAPGDPRIGMLGGSYAGGIQLMTAAADQRVDAIAPDIAWNDLPLAIFPRGVNKLGWDVALYALGTATGTAAGIPSGELGGLAIEIHKALIEGAALNEVSPESLAWFDARSPKHYINGATLADGTVIPGIHAPTLLTQGTIDTLFNLNQAIYNQRQIAANGVPTKMIFFCGGHAIGGGTACEVGDQSAYIDAAVLAWFDRYVRNNASSDTGPAIEYQLQDGTFASTAALPTNVATASGSGTLVNTIVPTSGTPLQAGPAPDGFRVPVPVPPATHLLGVPTATFSVTGVGPDAALFFKLIDLSSGNAIAIDDQVAPIRVKNLSGEAQTFTIDLTSVAWAVMPGHTIAVEVSPTSLDHSSIRTPFVAQVELTVRVPFRGGATVVGGLNSQYSSVRRPSIARMFARAQEGSRYSIRRPSMPIDQPGGRPPSEQASVRPHRVHVLVKAGAFALAGGRFEDFAGFVRAFFGGIRVPYRRFPVPPPGGFTSPLSAGRHPRRPLFDDVSSNVPGIKGAEMAAHRGKKAKKMGRISRRLARVERRALRIMMVPVILIAQRRMMRSLERTV